MRVHRRFDPTTSARSSDVAAAADLHASDYELIPPGGEPLSKDEYLGMIGRGTFLYDVFELVGCRPHWPAPA